MPKTIKIQYGTTDKKDATLVFNMLRPSDSLKVLLFVGKLLGGAAGGAISAFSLGDAEALNKLGEGKFDASKLGDAIPLILNRIDEKETLEKVNILLSSVNHEGTTLDLDYLIFDGRPDLFFRVLKEALVENYRFFLQENTGIFERLAKSKDAILASVKQSQNQQSTGSSGDQ